MKNVFGTKEWAVFNENLISGCEHHCHYCYAKEMAVRFKRKSPENWRKEELRPGLMELHPKEHYRMK